jgi:nicotinamidase-related amidase
MSKGMLHIDDCCLVIIDIQGNLAGRMFNRERLFKNLQILLSAARILHIPVLWCQQCPEALGPTIEQLQPFLQDVQPINKATFSCWEDELFRRKLGDINRHHVFLGGIETHICVYQTAVDLMDQGLCVEVIADATSARYPGNHDIAIRQLERLGVGISTVEMLLFLLLRNAEHPAFREIVRLIK